MKPLGWKTNSLLRTGEQQACGRRPLARRDSLFERAHSESQGWMSKKYGASGRGGVFLLDISFHRTCYTDDIQTSRRFGEGQDPSVHVGRRQFSSCLNCRRQFIQRLSDSKANGNGGVPSRGSIEQIWRSTLSSELLTWVVGNLSAFCFETGGCDHITHLKPGARE